MYKPMMIKNTLAKISSFVTKLACLKNDQNWKSGLWYFFNLKYATPQNTNPNQQSNNDDIKESKSEKKGITCAKMKANTQSMAFKRIHVDHPSTVWLFLFFDLSSKIFKNKNCASTFEYNAPKKKMVGKAKENAIFL